MTARESTVNAWQNYAKAKEIHESAKADPETREAIRKATSQLHFAELSAATALFTLIAFSVLLSHGLLWILAVIVFIGQVLAMTRGPAAERTLQDAFDQEDGVYEKFHHFLDTAADEARSLGFHVLTVDRNEKHIKTSEGNVTVAVDPETQAPELFLDGRPIRPSYRINTRKMNDLDGNSMNASDDALIVP